MTDADIIALFMQLSGFSEPDATAILQGFERKKLPKKTNLLEAGQVAKEVYFLTKGCIRLFYEKEGNDISAYFFTEGMFAGAYDSFVGQQPSRHFIETIEDCEVLSVTFNRLQELYQAFPAMNEFVRKVLEERFVQLHQLFTSQLLDSPEERYLNLLHHHPDLLQRIPQHQLATFLGVTPVSLSRIRHRIARK